MSEPRQGPASEWDHAPNVMQRSHDAPGNWTSTFGCQKLLFIFFYHITLSLSSFITAVSTGYTHTPWHILGSGLFLVFSLPLSHIPTLLTKHSRLPSDFRPHPSPGSVTLLLLLLSRWAPQPSQGTLPLAAPCRAPRPPGSYTWWSEGGAGVIITEIKSQ